jgi:hypothetical protein
MKKRPSTLERPPYLEASKDSSWIIEHIKETSEDSSSNKSDLAEDLRGGSH